jgi:hypothetical protein
VNDYLWNWIAAESLETEALRLRLRQKPREPKAIARSQQQLASFRYRRGDYASASRSIHEALATLRAIAPPDSVALVNALGAKAEIERANGRAGDAEESFQAALVYARVGPAESVRPSLLNNLAGHYKDLARYADALPLLQESLTLRRSLGVSDDELATAYLNLGEVYRLQLRMPEAGACYDSALTIARRSASDSSAALIPYLNQAAVYSREAGQPDRAADLLERTRVLLLRTLGPRHPWYAQNLADRATLAEVTGDATRALALHDSATALAAQIFGARHPETGAAAVNAARAAASAGKPSEEVVARLSEALAVLDVARAFPEQRLEGHALRARLAAGPRPLEARADFTIALDLADSIRAVRGGGDASRAAFVARRQELYDDAVSWAVDHGDIALAFRIHERGRARVLLDQMRSAGVDPAADVPREIRDSLSASMDRARLAIAIAQGDADRFVEGGSLDDPESRRRYDAAVAERDRAASELARLDAELQDRSPYWQAHLRARGDSISVEHIARALGDSASCFLAYHLGHERSFAFLVDAHGGSLAAYPLVSVRAQVDSLVLRGIRPALAADSTARLPESGVVARLHALWRALVPQVLWAKLLSASSVTIEPDGALHLLPFEALVSTPTTRYTSTRFWLDEGPVVNYASSAATWLELRAPNRVRTSTAIDTVALAVLDPDYAPAGGTSRWPRLRATALEGAALGRALAPRTLITLARERATERAVRRELPRRRIALLAAHGFVAPEGRSLLAGLALAPGSASPPSPEDDGYLRLYELYGLSLDADLIVLSACETHVGPEVAGEGVFALSRGFLAAGARRVVATQWAVRDDVQALLVSEFFDRWRPDGGPSASESLRDAKRALRTRWHRPNPADWSAPVLVGLR